ncbi:MAG: efflux RND transporter periplasmic adaptor subunit [Nitrospirae bacterium]|nr:efflux RND transporter periplasmic adaptor subunit [Nitrospirota bacterium]MDA8339488.1 efflux RND transporter periplasmic adaptor subunit [Nitrospiraceae bacterium]
MRKKFFTLILILLVGIAVFISGCGKKESPKEEKPATEKKEGHEKEEPGVVILSEEKQKAAGIEVQKIAPESVSAPISATAVIELNADRVSKISPRTSGRIVRLIASLGDRVKAGQPLAYFDSPELGQIWAEYLKAKGRVELTRKNLKREETLFEKKISPEKDVLKARQELSEAEADISLSKERFRLLGIDITPFEAERKNGDHPLLPLSSPISGAVIEKNVSQGEVVGPEKALFTVADLSTLWVVIDIYEKDIPRLKTGMGVKLAVTAFPDKDFRGRISYIGDVVDEKTRTIKARVTVDNSGGLLKPGMFATVTIDAKGSQEEKAIAVPQDAVLMDGEVRYVFVQTAPDRFKRKDIKVGRTFGKKIEVIEGLKEGDTVVGKGSFVLKSELKKEELAGE